MGKEQLAKTKGSGKTANNNNWRNKYKERAAPAADDLPALPFGWIWSSLGQVFGVHVGATPSRQRSTYWNGDLPWVSSSEVAFAESRALEKPSQSLASEILPQICILWERFCLE